MSNCALDFAFANEEEAFAIVEDVCGTLKVPTANDRLYSVGPIDFTQEQEFLDDEQIRASPSQFSKIKGRLNPGEWSLNSYVKPSGTLGIAPEHNVLFRGLMGGSFALHGSHYKYRLANQLDSFSLWVKKGHTVIASRGVTVEQAEFGVAGEEIAGIAWSGKYMQEHKAGTTTLWDNHGNLATSIRVHPGQSQLYDVGAYINVGTSTGGHKITAINYTNDRLTITPGLAGAQAGGAAVRGYWPATSDELGTPVHGKMGMVEIDNVESVIISARVTVTNNIKYYENEKNNLWTAERYGRPKFRDVDGELELHLLEEGVSYWYRASHQVQNALLIPVGNVSGYIMHLYIPHAEYRTPKVSGEEEFTQNVPFVAVVETGTSNDEIEIRFL